MGDSVPAGIAGVVLAAGAGERLRPLTRLRPKPLCPVGNVPLVDLAIGRLRTAIDDPASIAVNVHHGRKAMEAHLAGSGVHVSIEEARALGTAGAIGQLRGWLDGRDALIINADAWHLSGVVGFVDTWDRERVRILTAGTERFGPRSRVVASLLPWKVIESLEAVPSGLYERCWRDRAAAGVLETVAYGGPFVDCGTPRDYLVANQLAINHFVDGGSLIHPAAHIDERATVVGSVVGAGATVRGHVRHSVVWDGAQVLAGEHLDRAIRADQGVTVLVR